MNTFDQVPLHPSDFAENPEDRCPVLLLLDTSLSMQGAKIDALNQGLQQLHAELLEDKLAAKRVEIGIVGFGPVRVVSDFQSVNQALMPTLVAEGNTPMGAAIAMGLELLKTRKATIRSHGLNVYRPWVFMITDGESTDAIDQARDLIREGEASKAFMFYAVGVGEFNMEALRSLCVREPLRLRGLMFKEFFSWLSSSLSAVSQSRPGDQVALANPTAPNGWGVAG
jgi:uncharacterized protein YegL